MKAHVCIRPPTSEDAAPFIAAVRESRALHRKWVSPPRTLEAFRAYLRRFSSNEHRGFLVVHKTTKEFVGVINVSHIIRGAFRSAFLGYYAFAGRARQGLMGDGMCLVLRHVFRQLKLHRLEANIQPQNHASRALVESCGFTREGYSQRYLKVAGRWEDHERWAITAEDFSGSRYPVVERPGAGQRLPTEIESKRRGRHRFLRARPAIGSSDAHFS